jgi:hypothetical protein
MVNYKIKHDVIKQVAFIVKHRQANIFSRRNIGAETYLASRTCLEVTLISWGGIDSFINLGRPKHHATNP